MSQRGSTLVEKRECTSASAETTLGSTRSGKKGAICRAISIPL